MKRSREPEDDPPDSTPPLQSAQQGSEEPSGESLPAKKITELDQDVVYTEPSTDMKCILPPHRETLSFKTYDEYEAHYHKAHTNRCVECSKNFPSEHLLSVHIEECHDAFAAVKRERGEHTYSCFVEGCERKCRTPQKRRMHLIDKHMYPNNFFFAVTKEGIDGRRSLLLEGGHRRRRSSLTSSPAGMSNPAKNRSPNSSQPTKSTLGQTRESFEEYPKQPSKEPSTEEQQDTEMDDLAETMSALQFVPTSVQFGRGGRKAGFSKR